MNEFHECNACQRIMLQFSHQGIGGEVESEMKTHAKEVTENRVLIP